MLICSIHQTLSTVYDQMHLDTLYGDAPDLVTTTEIVDSILSVNLVSYDFKTKLL